MDLHYALPLTGILVRGAPPPFWSVLFEGALTTRNYYWHSGAGVVCILPQVCDQRWERRPHSQNTGTFLWLRVLFRRGLYPYISGHWTGGLPRKKFSEILNIWYCKVGKISKQWSGLGKEVFTDADNFGINFPLDLDVKVALINPATQNFYSFLIAGESHPAWGDIPDWFYVFWEARSE